MVSNVRQDRTVRAHTTEDRGWKTEIATRYVHLWTLGDDCLPRCVPISTSANSASSGVVALCMGLVTEGEVSMTVSMYK